MLLVNRGRRHTIPRDDLSQALLYDSAIQGSEDDPLFGQLLEESLPSLSNLLAQLHDGRVLLLEDRDHLLQLAGHHRAAEHRDHGGQNQ